MPKRSPHSRKNSAGKFKGRKPGRREFTSSNYDYNKCNSLADCRRKSNKSDCVQLCVKLLEGKTFEDCKKICNKN